MTEQRYARQQQVSQLSGDAQQKISQAKVLVVGVGGLGSPLGMQLAGAGVGELTLVDSDVVSLSNLHRQNLYTESDIDKPKAEMAKARLESLNSDIRIAAISVALSIENAEALVRKATVVVDAADSFFVSYLLSDLCFKYRIPLVSASVLTTHGYVGVFCGTEEQPAPSMRAIFPAPPSEVNNCSTTGVTGPSVGIISSIQAQEVLKVIIGDDSQLLGKLLYVDCWDYRQNIVDFSSANEPDKTAQLVSQEDLTEDDCLLDVRTAEEIELAPHPSVNESMPISELKRNHQSLPLDKRIVCICKSGQRALGAANVLLELGFERVAVTV